MKAFSGKLYRPDVAPADDGDSATKAPAQNSAPAQPSPMPAQQPAATRQAAPAPAQAGNNKPKPAPTLSNPLFEAAPPRKG
jgi:hypothetical protein